MAKGTVKFFNSQKGFGFITPDGGGKEIFVHSTGLVDQIRDGDQVQYEVESTQKRTERCTGKKSGLKPNVIYELEIVPAL